MDDQENQFGEGNTPPPEPQRGRGNGMGRGNEPPDTMFPNVRPPADSSSEEKNRYLRDLRVEAERMAQAGLLMPRDSQGRDFRLEAQEAYLARALEDARVKRTTRLSLEEIERNIAALQQGLDTDHVDRQRGQEALKYYLMLREVAIASGITRETEELQRTNPHATAEELHELIKRDDEQRRKGYIDDQGRDHQELRMAAIEAVIKQAVNLRSSTISLSYEWMLQGIADLSINREALATQMYGFAVEYAMERELTDALDVSPFEEIKLTGPQQSNMQFLIGQVALAEEDIDSTKPFYRYLNELFPVRLAAHEIFRNARIDQGHFTGAIVQHLRRKGLHFLENEIAGVKETRAMAEKIFAEAAARLNNWITDQELDKLYEKIINDMRNQQRRLSGLRNSNRQLPSGVAPLQHRFKVTVDGRERTVARDLRDFQMQRAGRIGGTILPAMTGRTNLYVLMRDIPPGYEDSLRSYFGHGMPYSARAKAFEKFLRGNTTGSAKFIDLYYESEAEYTRGLGQYYMVWYKTNRDGSISVLSGDQQPMSEDAHKQMLKDHPDWGFFTPYEAGYIAWHNKDTGIKDPNSQGWRIKELMEGNELLNVWVDPSNILARGNKEMQINKWMNSLGGVSLEALGVRDERGRIIRPVEKLSDLHTEEEVELYYRQWYNYTRGVMRAQGNMAEYHRLTEDNERYLTDDSQYLIKRADRMKNIIKSHVARDVVLSRKFNVGGLLLEGWMTPSLKAELWRNVARTLPSRMIAMLGEKERKAIMSNDDEWNVLLDKIHMLEQARLTRDVEETESDRHHQMDLRVRATQDELARFYDAFDLTARERQAIQAIVQRGEQMAPVFARAVYSFNQFLDDVPETNWMNLGDEDLLRLLTGDHKVLNESYDALGTLLANPTIDPAEFLKTMEGWAKGWGAVYGTEGGTFSSQVQVEKAAMTRWKFVRKKDTAKLFGGINGELNGALGIPRSISEEHNLAAHMAYEPRDISNEMDMLAKKQLLSDNPNFLDALGLRQVQRLRKRLNADLGLLFLRQMQLLQYLFPSMFLMQFIKTVAPEEVTKALK